MTTPKTTKKIEIMAPAGSYESLQAAINAGCDSVYFGVTQLNMRAVAASNFDLNDLEKITSICHENGVKAYLTLNTILYEHDLILAKKIIEKAKECNVDAIIASDVAAIQYAQEIGQPIHISTMQSISNSEAVKYFAQFSDVLVLARELTLPMIKKIHKRIHDENITGPSGEPIKLEAFAHGALCIAVSGRCFMSLHNHNASACRGACRQECRREYKIIDMENGVEMILRNNYVMSPSDLSTIDILDKVIDAGIEVLKFEGRGRPPEYVDTVVRCYKEAVQAVQEGTYTKEKIEDWKARLQKVYNRTLSPGFLFGQNKEFWSNSGHNQATEERIYAGKVTNYFAKPQAAEVLLEAAELKKGDKIIFTGETTGLVREEVTELRDDDENQIDKAEKKMLITIKTTQPIRKRDKVYILKERTTFK